MKTTLVGRTTITERIASSVTNLYAAYPHADKIVVNLHALYITCQILRDSNYPPDKKLKMFEDFMRWSAAQRGAPPVRPARRPTGRKARVMKEPNPPWAAYVMTEQEAAKAVSPEEAKAKPWCVPSFPDMYTVVLAERDRFLYYGAARDALKANGQIRLVAHAFETGMTREYSLALGGRKAGALRDLLVEMGIPAQAISTLSKGREGDIEPIGSRYCGVTIEPAPRVAPALRPASVAGDVTSERQPDGMSAGNAQAVGQAGR